MRYAPALLALGYGAFLIQAFVTGTLFFYIHPVYVVPTAATGGALLALAALGVRAPIARPSPWAVALLAVPLALGVILPAQPLSPSAAARRGVESLSLGRGEPTSAFEVGARPETLTIKDWVKAFEADPEPSRHAGKTVRVTGFVHRDAGLPEGWFLVARFVVQCCAVDAQPVGLPVRSSADLPEAGRWVTVEGAWDVVEQGGRRRGVIMATALTPTARPDQPYLY